MYTGRMTRERKDETVNSRAGHTPHRTIRVDAPTWDAAMARAEARGTSLSEEIRKFLIRYGKRP